MQSVKKTSDSDKQGTMRKSKDSSWEVRSSAADVPKTQSGKVEPTEYAAAVKRVQEWNEALNGASSSRCVLTISCPGVGHNTNGGSAAKASSGTETGDGLPSSFQSTVGSKWECWWSAAQEPARQ